MQENGLFAQSCIDEQSFILPFYPLGDPTNPFFLPPALLIGTSQIGIDLFEIEMKIKTDIAIDSIRVMGAYTDGGTTRKLFCDTEAENVIETLTTWLGMDPTLIPGLLESVEKDALFHRIACETVITSYANTNNHKHYPYNIVLSTYDRENLTILVQITYYDEDPTHSTEAFIEKLQPLIDIGFIEVKLVYRRPNRAKASQSSMWYQTTSALLHSLWDPYYPGVNVVPFKSPGSFDLYQYINGGVCQNGYSFHHMFAELTCPENPMDPPEINFVNHGHGCGSMYSEDQVSYTVTGNMVQFLNL
jgi:hypothetical protein